MILSNFTLVIITVSAKELTFLYALSHFDFSQSLPRPTS